MTQFTSILDEFRQIWPYIAANVVVLTLISLWPDLSLWLPRLVGLL